MIKSNCPHQERYYMPVFHSLAPSKTARQQYLWRTLSACLLLILGACSNVPVTSPQSTAASQAEQQLSEAKHFFFNKQYDKAAALLLPLAQQGHLDAQYSIGYLYHYGYGLPRNEKESTRWIATAAARGHLIAQQALALINNSHDKKGPSVRAVPQP
jgi:TPR repeat protein